MFEPNAVGRQREQRVGPQCTDRGRSWQLAVSSWPPSSLASCTKCCFVRSDSPSPCRLRIIEYLHRRRWVRHLHGDTVLGVFERHAASLGEDRSRQAVSLRVAGRVFVVRPNVWFSCSRSYKMWRRRRRYH